MRESSKRRQRVRWLRIGWLLPLALAAGFWAAPMVRTVLSAAREHQVRAYLSPLPPRPSEWRWTASQPAGVDAATLPSPYPEGARR